MVQRGHETRVALIEVAERLFAEHGIESVSLRDISSAAGQRNHSAAQYHFGDRAGLVAAVFSHRMDSVNERRHALLDRLAADDDLEALVDATVRPLLEVVVETDGWYARFLVRTMWDPFARQVVAGVAALSSLRRVTDLIVDRLDGSRQARLDRIDQMATLFIGTIAGWEWRRRDGLRAPDHQALLADLTATCLAVLVAPTRHPLETRT